MSFGVSYEYGSLDIFYWESCRFLIVPGGDTKVFLIGDLGYIWLATYDDLIRSDGFECFVYSNKLNQQPSNRFITNRKSFSDFK